MIHTLLTPFALAAGLGITPSDGIGPTGPTEPAWVVRGAPALANGDFAALARELDTAWAERRQLDNAAALGRINRLVAALRPTLDGSQRDLLQRALFARGVLEIDEAGDLAKLPNAIRVRGQAIPASWAEAISVSPGAPAPSTADAAFATNIYEQARTVLAQEGGVVLNPSSSAGDDVRVDGSPVNADITLLAGVHTLSWHPVGRDPVVLQVRVGGEGPEVEVSALTAWLTTLHDVWSGRQPLDPATRTVLYDHFHTPAVLLVADRPPRLAWLVDGAARWGAPSYALGVGAGVGAFLGGNGTGVVCDGSLDEPGKAVGSVAAEGAMTAGPWRVRAAGGVMRVLRGGFAAVQEGTCDSGLSPASALVATLPWGWVSAGRRFGVGGGVEVEPLVRVGSTSAFAVAQLGVDLRVVPAPLAVDVRLVAGPALNTWSDGGARAAVVGGVETSILFGRRR